MPPLGKVVKAQNWSFLHGLQETFRGGTIDDQFRYRILVDWVLCETEHVMGIGTFAFRAGSEVLELLHDLFVSLVDGPAFLRQFKFFGIHGI